MKSSSKKTISFCLLALFAWSSLFGAGDVLLVCLHAGGSGHISDSEQEDCCHQESTSVAEIHVDDECNDCTDVEFTGNEITSIRPGSSKKHSVPSLAVLQFLTESLEVVLPKQIQLFRFFRTTPKLLAHSVAIARQLVLRL